LSLINKIGVLDEREMKKKEKITCIYREQFDAFGINGEAMVKAINVLSLRDRL